VVELEAANLGAEDFSYFVGEVPGCYIRFGARAPGSEGFPAHSSRFDFDEAALSTGAEWFARVAACAGEKLAQSK
jgi:hippurate hydrolase